MNEHPWVRMSQHVTPLPVPTAFGLNSVTMNDDNGETHHFGQVNFATFAGVSTYFLGEDELLSLKKQVEDVLVDIASKKSSLITVKQNLILPGAN